MNWKSTFILALIMVLCGSVAIAQSSHWLHVKVETEGAKAEQVKVNVPLKLVETVIPMLENQELTKGKIPLDKIPLTVPQMREIWQTLKSEGDFELASVKDGDMDLKIFKEGEYLYIRTAEEADEEISVTIPGTVVDALLSGEDDELDLMAAAKALTQSDEGELVSIRDGDETVRIWIDMSSSSSE